MARRRNPRGEGDRLRDELLDATESLLAERGDERAVTIRAVVERVGVSPPALYLHFPTKHDLVREAVERGFGDLARATSDAAASPAATGDVAGALRAGVLAYITWAHDHPGRYAALFNARRDTQLVDDDGAGTSIAFERLVDRITACRDAGLTHDRDPRRLATLVWTGGHGIATLMTARDRFPWPPVAELVDELLAGVVGLPRPSD